MVIMDEIGDQVLQTQTLIYIPGVILFVLLFEELGEFWTEELLLCQVTSSLTAAKAAREHAISGAYHATAGKFFCLTFALVSSWSSFRFLFKWLLCLLLLPWGVSVFAYILNWVFYIIYWNRCSKESKGIGGSCLFSAFYYVPPLLPCWASAGHLHGTPINAESITADERNIYVFRQNKLLHEQIAVLGRSFLDLLIEFVLWIPV